MDLEKQRMEAFIISQDTMLASAMQKIDDNSGGVLFVVNERNELTGAVSDGDIRRWILKEGSLDTTVFPLMNPKPKFLYETEKEKIKKYIETYEVSALPVLDVYRRIVDIVLDSEKHEEKDQKKDTLKNVPVIIMAGGKGTRLYPYTKILPKPLIPIGEIPIVERVIDGFHNYGIGIFFMTVNYKKNMIQSYFSDVEKDYSICYVEEDKPLGTAGSLKLIKEKFESPVFVANCDSLVRTDYALLYEHHLKTENAITIVTSLKSDRIPYGVVYSRENGEIDRMVEKPTVSYLINTGMYVVNPEIIELIPEDTMFHMTQLVERAQEAGYKIGMYPVSEDSFLDMGEFAEMKRMEEKLKIQ